MDRTYEGARHPVTNAAVVTVNGGSLDPSADVANGGPSGFDWGFDGSGSRQLALAVLADHLEHAPDDRALLLRALGLAPTCDVCGGDGALYDEGDPVDLGRRFLSARPGTLLAARSDGDPCWNCQDDHGERSTASLLERGSNRLRSKLIAPLANNVGWTLTTADVHRALAEMAETHEPAAA
jgi:hypothetical protein